jgi:sugar-phosphatase
MKRFECRAILFDLDGVLVDSRAYVEEQWRRWAVSKNLPVEPFLRVCHGRRALETIRLGAPHLDAAAEVAAFRPDNVPIRTAIGPIDGAAALLPLLPPESWAVATSGSRAMAVARLEEAGLPLPQVLICAEDVQHGKPDPHVYLLAAAAVAAPPSECLVVEDAPAGIQAARAAGMQVVGLTTTHSRGELQADAWASSLAGIQLEGIVQGPTGTRLIRLLVPQDGDGLDLAGEARLK